MPAVPQPFPYQGSKRRLAAAILAHVPGDVAVLREPFAGSAAVTLAAAARWPHARFALGDVLDPLVGLWAAILADPDALAEAYAGLWEAAAPDPRGHYEAVRAAFHDHGDPARLLYLLARCVKGAVRFNAAGRFNQSADHRRRGTRPATVRTRLRAAHALLAGRTTVARADYAVALEDAGPDDVVFLDPPYVGVSGTGDARYVAGLDLPRLVDVLDAANARGVAYLVTLDGRTGDRTYAAPLPDDLGLARVELSAGRSSQATLLGRDEATWESLYLSPALSRRLGR